MKNKKKNFDDTKKINLGIEILRSYMSFSIIVFHIFNKKYRKNFLINFIFYCSGVYVRTFFLISFYFIFNTIFLKNTMKIKERFIRILIPYSIWPIIFLIYNILNKYIKFDSKIILAVFLQLLTGYRFYPVFWFLFNLIFVTIIITVIRFSFNKNHNHISAHKNGIQEFYVRN